MQMSMQAFSLAGDLLWVLELPPGTGVVDGLAADAASLFVVDMTGSVLAVPMVTHRQQQRDATGDTWQQQSATTAYVGKQVGQLQPTGGVRNSNEQYI